MSESVIFECACPNEAALVDIVFIHGLTGDAYQTWQADGCEEFWPCWLQDDLQHVSIYTLGFPASLFAKWAKKEMDIFERAGNVLEWFAARGLGGRPIIFVTHSLGGLLAKILLTKSSTCSTPAWQKISEATRLVVFYATPHTGSYLANVLKVLPLASSHIALLANESGFLEELNANYRAYALSRKDLGTVVYYETYKTKNVATVVSRDSADPGVAGCEPVSLDNDHISICKIGNKDDIRYESIRLRINAVVDSVAALPASEGGLNGGEDYTESVESDRRTLLQKLIAAGREHEYNFANDAQNKFARKFVKTGLLSAAENDHHQMLADVQQRFETHVYLPLICKYAASSDIVDAVQSKVIDPVSTKMHGATKFDSKTVMNALYFLTERCHIRWDAEQ